MARILNLGAHATAFGNRSVCLRACPLLHVGLGEDPFAVREELLETGLQLEKVGGVAAEVTAADAAVLVGAGVAAGLDVRRLGADAERHRDLADSEPGVFFGDESGDVGEDAAALARICSRLSFGWSARPSQRVWRSTMGIWS